MEKCKKCGKPWIPYKGKCVYCGAYMSDETETAETEYPPRGPYRPGIVYRETPRVYSVAADFVFCLDCSSSMLNVLNSIKDNIIRFMESIDTMEFSRIDWRARVMGYRNFDVDEEYLMNDNPFVSSVEELRKQLDGMEAKGYVENEPCSTLDAIWYAAKKSEWRNKCLKIILVFTDAQTKPVNKKTCDEIKEADDDLDILAKEFDANHIRLCLRGLEHSVYVLLMKIPRSIIVQFKDSIEYYYHKDLELDNLLYYWFEPKT